MWLRSTPIRKAVVGSVNPVHAPVVSGPWQTERSPNPIPRAGVKTSPTPFFRSNARDQDRKSTRLNSSHGYISYAVFCLKKKKTKQQYLHTSLSYQGTVGWT